MRAPVWLGPLIFLLTPGTAPAGEARCWFERGEVVVAAEIAGVAGDYILDLNAPHSLLHDTRAQAAGIVEPRLQARVQLAGLSRDLEVEVTDLDARGAGFSTPIAGVLGLDVFAGRALEVRLNRCSVRLRDIPPL